jgi:hypothetical protein
MEFVTLLRLISLADHRLTDLHHHKASQLLLVVQRVIVMTESSLLNVGKNCLLQKLSLPILAFLTH